MRRIDTLQCLQGILYDVEQKQARGETGYQDLFEFLRRRIQRVKRDLELEEYHTERLREARA